jgi:phage shock protein A
MPEWLKKLLNKLDDPELMLEQSYREFESQVIGLRKEYAASIAREKQLERKLANKGNSPEATATLETELIKQRSVSEAVGNELQNKESEIQKAYTKKQAFLARRKAEEPHFADPTRATLIIIAIMTAWALIGIFINIKGH